MVNGLSCSFSFSLFLHSFIGFHVPFTALNGTSMTTRQGNGRNIWWHDHVTPTTPSIHCSFCVQHIVGQVEFSCVLTSKKAGVTFLEHSHISHISLLFSQKNQVNCFPNSTTYNLVAYIFRSFLGLKISSGEKQVWTCVSNTVLIYCSLLYCCITVLLHCYFILFVLFIFWGGRRTCLCSCHLLD